MRGNRLHRLRDAIPRRSIPACAGEPRCPTSRSPPCGVYPRVCGGTPDFGIRPFVAPGLSPRVRGNLARLEPARNRRGSIPACAGEPINRLIRETTTAVYPRVCGGTRLFFDFRKSCGGLSPRVRGNRVHRVEIENLPGSIPACAGEPYPVKRGRYLNEVYPRVCGGTIGYVPKDLVHDGLSPRVRGTNSLNRSHHPDYGLSPRVRGNRGCNPASPRCGRSIPACAGEPKKAKD